MTVHRHGLSYAGPVPEGHTRCLSVQPPDVVAGLIDSGEHRPRLRLAENHPSMPIAVDAKTTTNGVTSMQTGGSLARLHDASTGPRWMLPCG